MPRKERLFIAGMPQLIAFKGNNNEAVFRDAQDYRFFLTCLKKAIGQHAIRLHAYALLESRILLLLSADDKTALARFTQYLGRCYVLHFNQRHGRTGVLWEGRYRSCSIEPSSYFLLCQKYVESRVSQGVDASGEIPWSSARANAGDEALDFLTPHAAFLALAADDETRHARFRQFMFMPLAASLISRIEECLRQNSVLGTLDYCLELENRLHQPVRPRMSGRPRKYYPNRLNYWLWLEQEAQSCIEGYAYREIRLPLFESPPGAPVRDLSALLRSEGTMGCLHAIAEQHMATPPCRLWYQGPMFRLPPLPGQQVEQFHQIGAEALGFAGEAIELELLLIQYELIQRLKLSPFVELLINTHGDAAARVRFDRLTRALAQAGVPFSHRQDLLPHHGYYRQTFYEWHTAYLDAHPVICRGGRYDELASRVMGRATPACGFAFMVEPVIQLAEKLRSAHPLSAHAPDVVILNESPACADAALHLGQTLRSAYPYLAVLNDYSRGRLAGKQARALKNGARILISLPQQGEGADLYNADQAERFECPMSEVVSRVRRWLI